MNLIIQNIIEVLKNHDGVLGFNDLVSDLKQNYFVKADKNISTIVEKELRSNPKTFFEIESKKNLWALSAYKNRYYWVSQNQTFKVERREGYLWAPYKNSKRKELFHWETMRYLKKGDVIFSHYKGQIKCISVVKDKATENYERPKEFKKTLPWMNLGRMVKVDYVDIEPLNLTKEIIKELNKYKPDKNWIYDRNLKHNVIYLLPLPLVAAKYLIDQIKKNQKITIQDIEYFNEDHTSSLADIKNSKRKSGQGFGLSYKEKKIVEKYAMDKYKNMMLKDGWSIQDFSSRRDKGYDIFLEKNPNKILAEIKGTTGSSDKIILTKNEVAAAKKNYPYAALIIVSGIHLDRSKDPPLPSLGKVKEIYNWQIENHNLEPINFYYTIDK